MIRTFLFALIALIAVTVVSASGRLEEFTRRYARRLARNLASDSP